MSEVTNEELLQAIKDMSGEIQKLDRKVDRLEIKMQEMRTDLKQDIRKLDQKFKLVPGDLLESRTDISILQQANG